MTVPAINVSELGSWIEAGDPFVLLDVREPAEREIATLPGAVAIPLREVPARAAELPPEQFIVVYCHHGGRSAQATDWLRRHGFKNAVNLTGGIDAWAVEVDPTMARY